MKKKKKIIKMNNEIHKTMKYKINKKKINICISLKLSKIIYKTISLIIY